MTKLGWMMAVLGLAGLTPSAGAFCPTIKTTTGKTELAGVKDFVGRFRRKKTVPKIEAPIAVGDPLPSVDVEIVDSMNEDGILESSPVAISDFLGEGTNVLVGMPGAFTTVCTKEHLPGFISAAPTLKKLGVKKIAIVTTNDRYVNSAWAEDLGLLKNNAKSEDSDEIKKEEFITILSDGDGDMVRTMGLAEDMGFGVGFRSKRFVMLIQDGKASYLAVDEGMEDCSSTAAPALVKFLSPKEEGVSDEIGVKDGGIIAAGAAVLLAALLSLSPGNDGTSSSTTPTTPSRPPAIQKAAPPAKTTPATKSGGFSLLDTYIK